MSSSTPQIEVLPLASLRPYPGNARRQVLPLSQRHVVLGAELACLDRCCGRRAPRC